MGRKKFKPSNFEYINSPLSATIYADMLTSKPFMNLSAQAKELYLYMKLQYYGQKKIEGKGQEYFYFNRSMYENVYHLYTNGAQFSKYKKELIENGFIDEVENGRLTRTKNIYCFSERWKTIK